MCWDFKLKDNKKTGDIMVGDVPVKKDVTPKGKIDFIEQAKAQASKKGITLEEYLDELVDITKIEDAIKELQIKMQVPKNRLSAEASIKKLDNVVNKLKKGSKRFNPEKKRLKDLGIELKRSKSGLSVDFEGTKFLYPVSNKQKNIVKIKLTGHDDFDFKLANKLAGMERKPKGYTWHHLDDYDPISGTCTMQLVKTNIHQASCPHYGGVKVLEDFFNFKYLSRL